MSKSADFLPACENDPTGLLQALHPLHRLFLALCETPPAHRLELNAEPQNIYACRTRTP